MRYPESLSAVQRELLAKYHASSANQFFSGEDFWQTPPTRTNRSILNSETSCSRRIYLTLQTGGSSEPVFSLTVVHSRRLGSTREILTGSVGRFRRGPQKGKSARATAP